MEFKKEPYTYQGQDLLPNETWHPYFKMSEVGKQYEVLYESVDGQPGKLVMSDTEYEMATNTVFFNAVKRKGPGCKVLSIGYGIGFINERMKEFQTQLTVVEKYQQVLELNTIPESIRIIVGDINNIPLEQVFHSQEFDIIFSDITYCYDFQREKELQTYLKPDGKFIYWTHLT